MITYEDALLAMEHLLDRIEDRYWRDSIREDLRLWQASRDVAHHLGKYGGMGSFNDVLISRGNEYAVRPGAEPWADQAFRTLRSICYLTAHEPSRFWTAAELRADLGSVDPGMEGFAQGPDVPKERGARTMFSDSRLCHALGGRLCPECGYAETRPEELEVYLAEPLVVDALLTACEASALVPTIDRILDLDLPEIDSARATLRQALAQAGVTVPDSRRGSYESGCPRCSRGDLRWHPWVQKRGEPYTLERAPSIPSVIDDAAEEEPNRPRSLWRRVKVWWREHR